MVSEMPTADTSTPKKRILLVEDEESVRHLAKRFLDILGYETLEAEDGQSALQLFTKKSVPVDLVIADMIMPDMNGRELVKKIREIRPDMKALYVSGYGAADFADNKELGTNEAFTQKPYSLDALQETLSRLLDQ
jgi:CheY-like chemotaxis protein